MPLEERVAQLVMVQFYGDAPNTKSKEYREYLSLVRDMKVGGLIVLNRVQNGSVRRAEPYTMAAFVNRMQRSAKVPLLLGGDYERGASMRMNLSASFPHAMAFGAAGDIEATRALGAATAREARALGVHWVFAPVADVNNNPENPIINIRSFSEDPAAVAAHVQAFIEGAHSNKDFPVLVTAKHFPGHGDTATDSHMGLGVVTASRERLDQVELVPFKAAIGAGVDAIMTAHLSVPALEPEPIPATISKNVLTRLLRDELKFGGFVVTDAMDMHGLSKQFPPGEAAVRAIEAGVDLLLIPTDPRAAIRSVVNAVRTGRIPAKRIDHSVTKLLEAKYRLGLHRNRLVDLEKIEEYLDDPDDQALAARVAENALTLVKNEGGLLPVRKPDSACYLVLQGVRGSLIGREFADGLKAKAPGAWIRMLDPLWLPAELDELAKRANECESIVMAAFAGVSSYRGSVGLSGNYPPFVEKILASGKPVAFLAFGNPYLLASYPTVRAYVASFTTSAPAETAAVRALFGEIPIRGKLPVTIPGQAAFGIGLTLDKSN
jgi:beta-N-acetylhexosaminidase